MFDTSPINMIINGDTENSITYLQRKFISSTNFILRENIDYNTTYLNDIAAMMSCLMYLKETDTTLLGLWKKRTTQIRGYATSLHFTDTNNKK